MRAGTLAQIEAPEREPEPVIAGWLEFASYLARKHSITGDFLTPGVEGQEKRLRELLDLTELSDHDFAHEVATFFRLDRLELPQLLDATALTAHFSHRFLREALIFPCQPSGQNEAILVVSDPTDTTAIRAAELVFKKTIPLAIASFEDIATVLSRRLGEGQLSSPEPTETATAQRDNDIEGLRDLASGAPVVRAVNDLLDKAAELRATDIHIEPFRNGLIVRMRVDGILRVMQSPKDILPQALLSRVKILAGLNIAERRLPQDGAAHLHISGSGLDIRVATMPTQHGESAVIRLLPRDRGILEIPKLGFSSVDQATIQGVLGLPHGIVVVTGPTGSGKTTTLATLLTALNDSTRKILTIEDPVEYEIPGINQSQVKPEIGLTFATALRAFVRQDPDVIMIGEIRDTETAHIAIHAALTGHLVLTTLHTETAAAAVPRLLDLGVENFLLQSTLRVVVAQRLVRILCDRCKVEHRLDPSALAADPRYEVLGLEAGTVVGEARGCERCSGSGYRGRTGVFEVLQITDSVRSLIGAHADSGTITDAARRNGMNTMFEHAIAKCRDGTTSAAEVLRVTTAR
jgi:general secretion pathway protein E